MGIERYEGVAIQRCTACGGVWLGQDEMREIVKHRVELFDKTVLEEVKRRVREVKAKIPPAERERKRHCPVCKRELVAINYNYSSGIIIDRCFGEHGVFLDKGELELVQAHAELMKAAANDTLDTYEEEGRLAGNAEERLAAARNDAVGEFEREALAQWEAEQRKKKEPILDRVLDWLGVKLS